MANVDQELSNAKIAGLISSWDESIDKKPDDVLNKVKGIALDFILPMGVLSLASYITLSLSM